MDNRRFPRAVWSEDQGDRLDRDGLRLLEGLEVFEGDAGKHGVDGNGR
jgi:hypothetical protein